jgi:hypothetical protein
MNFSYPNILILNFFMTSYVTSTFEQGTKALLAQLTQLVSYSETGAATGAVLGFSVGLCDYLCFTDFDNLGSGAISIILPTYTGYLLGSMPRLGVPVAITAILINEYNKCKHSSISILPPAIQSLIDDKIEVPNENNE